jgi:phage terminase large subunit-like protein
VPEFQPSAEQTARAENSFRRWQDDVYRRKHRVATGYHPQLKQLLAEEMLTGPQHNMMLVGGARSGKTFVAVKHLAGRALRASGKAAGAARQAILRLHLKDVGESIGMDTFPSPTSAGAIPRHRR